VGEDPLRRPAFAQLASILVLALVVMNLAYGFEGSFTPLGKFEFYSRFLSGRGEDYYAGAAPGNRFHDTFLGALPVPVPKNYLRGIDVQKADFEPDRHSYLAGEFRIGGWWYFYLYGLAVKVPLGTWLLVLLSVAALFIRRFRATWRDELLLALPVVVILVLVSSETGFTHHLRYVLPIAPFVFISVSKIARLLEVGYKKLAAVAGFALAWSVVSSLTVYPHSLSYFNELAGGPKNGANHLLDSNIDWGQDLWFLREWMDNHPEARPIGVQYFGFFHPQQVGIQCTNVPRLSADVAGTPVGPQRGWYAISVNSVYGTSREHVRATTPTPTSASLSRSPGPDIRCTSITSRRTRRTACAKSSALVRCRRAIKRSKNTRCGYVRNHFISSSLECVRLVAALPAAARRPALALLSGQRNPSIGWCRSSHQSFRPPAQGRWGGEKRE
jgi:hypothetical protein